tara:strand:- start:4529 stop:4879 length:351 start_codon:yes stop_codon:yes gene_type:complete
MEKSETKLSLLVLAPWGLDLGFRLGGAQVKNVSGKDSLNREIEWVFNKKEVGILAMPEPMKDWINKSNIKIIGQSIFPVIVYYRLPEDIELVPESEEEVADIVQRAIGFRLKIKLK